MSKKQSWYSIKARRPEGAQAAVAEIFIYNDIGESWCGESVSAREFIDELAGLDVENITVRINSFGGSVPDGLAIYNALKRHKASVTVAIDGVAMSIASLVAMAGDTVEMAENAILMIHAPWTWADGNSAQLRDIADQLDKWAEAMATSYVAKSGKPYEEILALLTDGKDHYFTAAEAQSQGYVDSITSALAVAASADTARARLRQFFSPAAAAAPHQENLMTGQVNPPAAPQPAAKSEAEIRAAALKDEQDRRGAILALKEAPFAKGNAEVVAAIEASANDVGCTVSDANAKVLAVMAKGAGPAGGGYVVTVEDERDKFRAGVTSALLARAGLAKDDTANNLRGFTLYEMARASLEKTGRRTDGLNKLDLVAAAFTHSSADFGNLLANVANKAMLKGYEEAEETFQRWTSIGTLPDFKPGKRVDLNVFPSLDLVADGGEYKYATLGDRGESVQLATYGKLFSITRQTIINDDLDSFSKIPMRMGRAAIRTVGNLVYAVLTANPAMADGKALFHSDHANLLTGAGISTDSVDAMRVAMAIQKEGGVPLNLRLAHLLVPVALEGKANVVRDSEYEVGASAKNNTVPNSVRGTFEVISDARLDVASPTVWYGAANSGVTDTIEVSYLDGQQAPTLEQQQGWNVDGTEFKVRLDAGVKALSFAGLAKNPGA